MAPNTVRTASASARRYLTSTKFNNTSEKEKDEKKEESNGKMNEVNRRRRG